jgi:MFS family permease
MGAMASTFRSVKGNRNAKLFFAGLLVSNIGNWVQFTAVAILVDRLTGKATAIGILSALQFGPMLLLGAWAGAVADRRDRRRMTLVTQGALTAQAVALAVLDLTGVITIGWIYALTLVLGVISAIDNPARRGFVTELVPEDQITNVVSLNTAVMTGSRIFGPAITAVLVGTVGTGWLFSVNAASYAAILAALFLIDRSQLTTPPRAPKGGTPVRDGLRYVRRTPLMLATFIVFAVVSTFGYNYNVSMPRIATTIWGNAQWYGWVLTANSAGSMLGSLATASRQHVTIRWMAGCGVVLGVSGLGLAWSPNPWLAMAVAVPVGLGGAGFVASMNAITQQECPPDMRGRILALTAVAFLGSYPIGGPITGLVGDHIGLQWSLGYGAIISLCAVAGLVWWALGRRPDATRVDTLRSLLGASTPIAASPSEHP